MDTVYVVMIDDRHTDTDAEVFSTADAAIEYARQIAIGYARNPDDIDEEPVDGWLYHATYSGESDSVWVLAKTVRDGSE